MHGGAMALMGLGLLNIVVGTGFMWQSLSLTEIVAGLGMLFIGAVVWPRGE